MVSINSAYSCSTSLFFVSPPLVLSWVLVLVLERPLALPSVALASMLSLLLEQEAALQPLA